MTTGPEPTEAGTADAAAGHTASRKDDHLRIALGEDVGFASLTSGLERWRVRARALPERALGDVDLGVEVFGRRLRAPLLISCMTGGTSAAGPVNRALAQAAAEHGVAFGLGSGRAALEEESAFATFAVRDVAPDVLVLANLGAVQLPTYGVDGCRRLVEGCAADALVLHLNAVQEAVQPGGDTDFSGVLAAIERLCAVAGWPVMVKEVGFGLGAEDARRLVEVGVRGIDVAGAGGTNWARVEGRRDSRAGAVATAFADWGWTTAEALEAARCVLTELGTDDVVLVGSGGLRHGVDALVCLCLGAELAGFARGLLAAASRGPDAAAEAVGVIVDQLRIGAWAAGAERVTDLGEHLLMRA